jgi:putative Mn2+ efflux pump MntP
MVLTAAATFLFTSVAMGLAAYVFLSSNFGDAHEKWAAGVIGTVLGFWMNQFTRMQGR